MVQLREEKRPSVVNDLTFAELEHTILTPWRVGRPFTVSGTLVQSTSSLKEIKITQTDQPKQHYADWHNREMSAAGIADMATDRRVLPLEKGRDWTYDLLFSGAGGHTPEPDVAMVERLCSRLPQAARTLAHRGRSKPPFLIEDEYDVQDLLHATLRAYLKYSVQEDPMTKVAGAKAGRADISIEELGVLIEVKFVRGPQDQKRLFEEHSQDLLLYTKWSHLKRLILLIYKSDDLRDAEAFEKLAGTHDVSGRRFEVSVVLA